MKDNFLIVLFKYKTKKKIINKFITSKKAKNYYENLLVKSNEVIFEKQFENGFKCNFELGLLEKTKSGETRYYKDTLGRQIKIELDDDNYSILRVEQYKIEELIVDYKTKKKITSQQLIKQYLSGDGIKMISKINNKVVVQNDDEYNLFTLKNDFDSERFIDSLSIFFMKKGKRDCILVKDVSTAQRKYLYDILVSKGFPKTYLFRHSTTHPILK
jgi:hypothetical protein